MKQWLYNGWQHPWTTLAGGSLAVLDLLQKDFAPSSVPLAIAILILGWVTTHPTTGK